MAAKTAKKTVKSSSKKTGAAQKNTPARAAAQTGKKAAAAAKKSAAKKTAANNKSAQKKPLKKIAARAASAKVHAKKTAATKVPQKKKTSEFKQTKTAAKSGASRSGKSKAKKPSDIAKKKPPVKAAAKSAKKAQVKPVQKKPVQTAKKIVKKNDKIISKKTTPTAKKSASAPKTKTVSKSSATPKAENKKNSAAKASKQPSKGSKKNASVAAVSVSPKKQEEKISPQPPAKQAKPDQKYREPIEDLPVKKRGKTHVRSSESIAFTLEDLDAYLERKENGNTISITKEIAISQKKRAQAAKSAQVAPKPEVKKNVPPAPRKPLEPASIFDILGFNPVEAPTREKLEEKDVPRKWKKYYNLLIDLRKHHSAGVEKRSEEVLKRSVKEDSGDLSSYGQHLADAGSESFERDMTYNILSTEKEILAEIDEAIKRIKNGTYGICEVTGMPIPDERLSAIPFTRYTKEGQERKELEQKRIKASQRNLYDIPENGVGGEDDSSAQ